MARHHKRRGVDPGRFDERDSSFGVAIHGDDYWLDRPARGYAPERQGVTGGYGGGHSVEPEWIGTWGYEHWTDRTERRG